MRILQVLVLITLLALPAYAQFIYNIQGGLVRATAQNTNNETVRICFRRSDRNPPINIACRDNVAAGQTITEDISIPLTPGDSAELRAVAINAEGLESTLSAEWAIIPMPPLAPTLLP